MTFAKVHFKFIGDSFNCKFTLPNHDLLTSLKRRLISFGFLKESESLYWIDFNGDLVLLDSEAALQSAVATNVGKNICVVSGTSDFPNTVGTANEQRRTRQRHRTGRHHQRSRHRSSSTISISSNSSSSSTGSSSSSSTSTSSSSSLSMGRIRRRRMGKKWFKKLGRKRFGKLQKSLALRKVKPHCRHMLQRRYRSHSWPPTERSSGGIYHRATGKVPFWGPYEWWQGFRRSSHHGFRPHFHKHHFEFPPLPPPPPPPFSFSSGDPFGSRRCMWNCSGRQFGNGSEDFSQPHDFPFHFPFPNSFLPGFQPPFAPHFTPPFPGFPFDRFIFGDEHH